MKKTKKLKKCLDCPVIITGRDSVRCPSCAAKERNRNPDYIKKQSLAQRGQKRSDESRKKMGESQKERFKNPRNHPRFGKGLIGKANGRYKDGRTPIIISLRSCREYKEWIKQVFERDNYTCQDCDEVGGQLEAHHEKAFSIIFDEFLREYNQFSIVEDKETLIRLAYTYKPFWDINNGKTLCEDCHSHNYTTRP